MRQQGATTNLECGETQVDDGGTSRRRPLALGSAFPHLEIFSVTDNGNANNVLSLEIVLTSDLCGTGVASEPVDG